MNENKININWVMTIYSNNSWNFYKIRIDKY